MVQCVAINWIKPCFIIQYIFSPIVYHLHINNDYFYDMFDPLQRRLTKAGSKVQVSDICDLKEPAFSISR